MQKQYAHKFRKLLSCSKNIVPTQYQQFYSLLKLICDSITSEDVTPELLNILSKIYNQCKDNIENCRGWGEGAGGGSFSEMHHRNQSKEKEKVEGGGSGLRKWLETLLEPLMKYLPKEQEIARLMLAHFRDQNFYAVIKKQKQKAQQMIIKVLCLDTNNDNSNSNIQKQMQDSGSMTPLVFPTKQRYTPTKPSQQDPQGPIDRLNQLLRTKCSNKIHINGNNQLSIIFWLSCFKLDYAVHFDIFWQYLQYYVNNTLTPSPTPQSPNSSTCSSCQYYPCIIPATQNNNIKQKIKSKIDIDNKYYITSANCNELFGLLAEPQFVSELIELTIAKDGVEEECRSSCCVNLVYRWRHPKEHKPHKDKEKEKDKVGSVFINNFQQQKPKPTNPISTTPKQPLLAPYPPVPPKQTLETSQNQQLYLTGRSIGYGTKILHNKYAPTIRFGSLQDNEICIKNRYISRRQFMIIQQLELGGRDGHGHAGMEESNGYKQDYDKSIGKDRYHRPSPALHQPRSIPLNSSDNCLDSSYGYNSRKNNNKKEQRISVYYLVCLSPSNHTSIVYNSRVEARPGVIFILGGIYIEIIRVRDVYENGGAGGHKLGVIAEKQEVISQSVLKIDDESVQSSQAEFGKNQVQQKVVKRGNQQKCKQEEQNESNFQLLTSIPISKNKQDNCPSELAESKCESYHFQQQEQQQDYDKTLEQLPTLNRNHTRCHRQIQLMYISGEDKNTKFIVSSQSDGKKRQNVIEVGGEIMKFQFEEKNGKYYIPAGLRILAKSANQVLSGHFSDKVRLEVGMRIVLEEIQFTIVQ